MTLATVRVQVHLDAAVLRRALLRDVREGLSASPKRMAPKWLYDESGCALFDEITRLPEYYPTRREREILAERSSEIASTAGADVLIELGSGTSDKTRMLLDAMTGRGHLRRFVAFDVSEPTVRRAGRLLADRYRGLDIEAVVGDFECHLDYLPADGCRMVAFLGGTIGNLVPAARARFLAQLAAQLRPGETLLLGADLVKDERRLVAAYDDARGVTARFNLNLLGRLNRELGSTFDLALFGHVARWDPEQEWMEMRLRALADQAVHIPAVGVTVRFAAGEEMQTEISAKFRRERLRRELDAAGFALDRWWTDRRGDFSLSLWSRR